MWQVDHELLATGKNVLNPKKFSKKPQMHTHTHTNPTTKNQTKNQSLFSYPWKVFILEKKGLCTEASALGHLMQCTTPSLTHCLMSCNITATIMQDLTLKMYLVVHKSQLLCVLCFCLATLAILLFKDCWLCY